MMHRNDRNGTDELLIMDCSTPTSERIKPSPTESRKMSYRAGRRKSSGVRFQIPGVPHAWKRTSVYTDNNTSSSSQDISLYRRGTNEATNLQSKYMRELMLIIEDPIMCGYLLTFCESEYSAENLNFVMDVDKFRDVLLADSKAWKSPWTEIDDTVFAAGSKMKNNIHGSDCTEPFGAPEEAAMAASIKVAGLWPSRVVQKRYIESLMDDIWDTYLSEDSPYEICNPPHVLKRTERRMELLHLYGPDVFSEALYEPLRTLRKDTLPRFLTSDLYKDAEAQLAATRPLPKAKSLTVPPPDGCICSKDTIGSLTDAQRFELNDILADKFLYSQFHHYLMKTIAAENLLCVRMILIFEDIIEKQEYSAARSHAWVIYKYFVAYGSAYEVSLNVRQRKNVMISLAKPTAETFKDLKSTTMSLLMANFNAYKFTDEYTQLSRRLRESHAPSAMKLMFPLLCNCIRDQPIVPR